MTITPEERASKIIGAAAMARYPMWIDIEKQIADAIGTAENDALERAAEAANWYAVNAPYGDAEYATVGEHIRALKHKDAG